MLLGQRRRRVASAGIRTVASRKRPPKKTLAPPSHLPRKRTPKKSLAPPSGGKGPQERLWHLPRRGEKTPRKTLAPPSQGGKDLPRGSPRAAPVDLRALHPRANRRLPKVKLSGNLGDGLAARAHQAHDLGLVLPCETSSLSSSFHGCPPSYRRCPRIRGKLRHLPRGTSLGGHLPRGTSLGAPRRRGGPSISARVR
jgi:hypothetical protein